MCLVAVVVCSFAVRASADDKKKDAPKKPHASLEARFKEMDANKDGKVTLEEYTAWHKKIHEAHVKKAAAQKEAKKDVKKDAVKKGEKKAAPAAQKKAAKPCPKAEKKTCPAAAKKACPAAAKKPCPATDKKAAAADKKACPIAAKKTCPASQKPAKEVKKDAKKAEKKAAPKKESVKKDVPKAARSTAEQRFKEQDANKDGKVSQAEFLAAHKRWPEARAKEIYKNMGGSDAGLTLEQYKKAREAWAKKRAEQKK
jgi:Ca2+-binding EF-hand superfamily protein